MESFVLVVLYHVLRYTVHNRTQDIAVIMKRVFDDYIVWPNGTVTGGNGMKNMFQDRDFIGEDIEFTNNPPLNIWIDFTLSAVAEWHEYKNPRRRKDYTNLGFGTRLGGPKLPADLLLKDHHALGKVWQQMLDRPDWPTNDKAIDYLPKATRAARSKRTIHESTHTEDGQSSESQPTAKKQKSTSGVGHGNGSVARVRRKSRK
jgi:hypothetical protein